MFSTWHGDFKDLPRRTEVLRDKAFNIAKNTKYYGHQTELTSKIFKFCDKMFDWSSGIVNNEIKQNLQLAEELHKPIIRNFKKGQFIHNSKTIFGVLIYN